MERDKIIIASAILLNEKKEMLTVRKKTSVYYMLPGGKIEKGEQLMDALLRELWEELNIKFTPEDFDYLGQHETDAVNEKNTIVQGNIFVLKQSLRQKINPHAELAEVQFISKENYKEFRLAHLLEEFALPYFLTC